MRASGPPHQNREKTRRVIQLQPQRPPHSKKNPFFERAEFFYPLTPISKANLQASERLPVRTTCPDLQPSNVVKVLHHNAVLLPQITAYLLKYYLRQLEEDFDELELTEQGYRPGINVLLDWAEEQ
jgi:hypothetical protein